MPSKPHVRRRRPLRDVQIAARLRPAAPRCALGRARNPLDTPTTSPPPTWPPTAWPPSDGGSAYHPILPRRARSGAMPILTSVAESHGNGRVVSRLLPVAAGSITSRPLGGTVNLAGTSKSRIGWRRPLASSPQFPLVGEMSWRTEGRRPMRSMPIVLSQRSRSLKERRPAKRNWGRRGQWASYEFGAVH